MTDYLLQQQVKSSGLQRHSFFKPSQVHLSLTQLVHKHLGLLHAIIQI